MLTGTTTPLIVSPPHPRLAPFVSHYWLSRNNSDFSHVALPDGRVDIVVESSSRTEASWIYGTTTRRTEIPVSLRHHYLGIRFRPGQSRHFTDLPARYLTDTHLSAEEFVDLPLERLAAEIAESDVLAAANTILCEWLDRRPPTNSIVDTALRVIESGPDGLRIEEVSRQIGLSRRQLERLFLDQVGLSPKSYLMIRRVRRAMRAIASRGERSLADIALEVGYADQSHMSRDFKQITGRAPGSLAGDVAFVQDATSPDL